VSGAERALSWANGSRCSSGAVIAWPGPSLCGGIVLFA